MRLRCPSSLVYPHPLCETPTQSASLVFCLHSVAIPGHEERGEIRGEEDGPTEGGPSQRPVSVQAANAQRHQG